MKTKKKTIILIIVILLLAVVGGILVAKLIKKSEWKKQELIEFSINIGGGMHGGSDRTTISLYDDKALLTCSHSDWYYEEPAVTEYLINKDVLDEIKNIFLEEGMYKWGGKKFTKLFIADGESTYYDFVFSEDDLSFSSQIYPEPYSDKLEKIDRIIEKYSVDREELEKETIKGDRNEDHT